MSVDLNCFIMVERRLSIILLLLINISKGPVSEIMAIIGLQGLTVAFGGCLEVFDLNVLVTLKSVSVGEEWIELQGSSKELKSSFMFLLHTITVTKNDPSLRLVGRSL